jgi:hypothetical protein
MSDDVHDVRYVCLSDLHLGDPDSILTPFEPAGPSSDPLAGGSVLEQLVVCLEHLLDGKRGDERPILILNGDALELAFGTFSQALTNFERLAGLLLQRRLFRQLIYIPGNHDHHIWEVARETQYANILAEHDHRFELPPLRHVTPLRLEEGVSAYLLNKIIERMHPTHGPRDNEHEVLVVYPNLALFDRSGRRCVLFHHGHYVEPLYHFFSALRRWLFPDRPPAQSIDEIEEENFGWIEFIWSLLGRSGGAGADMRALFRMLRDPDLFDEFASDLTRRTVKHVDVAWIPGDVLERLALKKLLTWIAPRLSGERSIRRAAFSADVRRGIERYLFGPTYRQLREEIGDVPEEMTFVFGHTHKPFEALLEDPNRQTTLEVYNTGGWPIDSREPFEEIGGSILFMNERLDAASLRVFNDTEAGGNVTLQVKRAGSGSRGSGLADWLETRLRNGSDREAELAEPWDVLKARIADAINQRRHLYKERWG